MKPGEVLALDLHALYPNVDRRLRGKFGVVVSLGAARKRDWRPNVAMPHTRWALAEPLFDALPTAEQVRDVQLLPMTHWEKTTPAMYFMPDLPLPPGVTHVGTLASVPEVEIYRAYSDWDSFAVIRHHEFQFVQKNAKAAPAKAAPTKAARKKPAKPAPGKR